MELDKLRARIDRIDRKLCGLLEKRLDTAQHIAREKERQGLPVLDEGRERVVLQKAEKHTREAYRPGVRQVFAVMMAASRLLQEEILQKGGPPEHARNGAVAYCGIPGSYAEEAARRYFGGETALATQNTFDAVVRSVAAGETRYGLLPVENSNAGAVAAVEDLLAESDVYITGEVILPVRHHLLGVEGARTEDIATVVSHPQAIEQCARYIASRGYAVGLSGNTAVAARDVAQKKDGTAAAIASFRAAQIYGLRVLEENIQDNPDNYTRFIVLGGALKQEGDKLSVVCVIPHQPGSLHALLDIFARRGLNLLKLLARPIAQSPWHYRFHIDLGGNPEDPNVAAALEEARARCITFKVTGCYRAAK